MTRSRTRRRGHTGPPSSPGSGAPRLRPARVTSSGGLPSPPAPIIGREAAIRSIEELLLGSDHRLVTLTGPPGSGKTRLALAAAGRLEGSFEQGVVFVELAPVAGAASVTPAVLRALGVPDTLEPPTRALVGAVGESHLLLVLDNFEHVLDARADVAEFLTRCPRVRILVTSRRRLELLWEREIPVPPLPVPDRGRPVGLEEMAGSPAVALFLDRARAVEPSFRLTAANCDAVAEICARVDGLPLAIELAAARVKHFSPGEIAREVGRGYHLLAAGPKDAPPRQRSLEAAIAWSHRLLDEQAGALFRRVSVFAGGATREAVAEVCGERPGATGSLNELVDSNLLQRAEASGGRSRFAMLATIRDFAARRLEEAGETTSLRRRHLDSVARLAEGARPHLGFFLPDEAMRRWEAEIEPEYDNVVAALEWAARDEAGLEAGLRLAVALHWWWFLRGRFAAARSALAQLLHRPQPVDASLRALAAATAAYLACWQGDFAAGRPLAQQALEGYRRLGDASGTGFALHALGFSALGLGEREAARAHVEDALALARAAKDDWLTAFAVSFLAIRAGYESRFAEAKRLHHECLAILRTLGGHAQGEGYSLFHLGRIARLEGDLSSARTFLGEALVRFRALADTRGMTYGLLGLALVAITEGQAVRAARLLGALDAARLHLGPVFERQLQRDYDESVAAARTALGEDAFSTAWGEGRGLTLDQTAASGAAPPASLGPPRRRSPLTSREEQVAALVAQGLTNRQIAETLVIGKKTVDSHVQHIMDKLGFHSRAQVAAWATEQRLGLPAES